VKIGVLRRRAAIVSGMRRFFDARGFLEVETPVRLLAPAPECFIDCPPVSTGGFLRASPELQMKKLLAAGLDRIYQIGPCFRDGENGARHAPEFTMIEWYRRGEDYGAIERDLRDLLAALCRETGTALPPIVRLGVREAYRRFAGWDPWTERDEDRFDFDMATKIEPALAPMGAVFLVDYPAFAASLARVRGETAERWEFYWNGLELANCFSELCDEDEQRRRFAEARRRRRDAGEASYGEDEAFFEALPRIGEAAGVALGVDRLVMALTGEKTIGAVRVTDGEAER
jgi:lysyl-tRNA synthetase class 2